MAATAPQGWPQLRQQARQLETQTEQTFQTYSQLSSSPSTLSPTPSSQETTLETTITNLLSDRSNLLASLSRLLDSDPQPSALKSSHLARHKETLTRHRADFARLKGRLKEERDRSSLLGSVRKDIASYRSSQQQGAEAEEGEYMLGERSRIDNSHNMADSVLSQAYAVNESFGVQRETLERVRMRVSGVVGMVPGVNGLIGRIGGKKRRDGVILGGFIAVCLLCFLWLL